MVTAEQLEELLSKNYEILLGSNCQGRIYKKGEALPKKFDFYYIYSVQQK